MTTNTAEPFETETMAALCAQQGRFGAAIAIYRNLLAAHPAHFSAAGWRAKLLQLQDSWDDDASAPTSPHDVPVPGAPGVVAVAGQDESGQSAAIVAWSLSPTSSPPVVEVMLLVKGAEGIEKMKRRIDVASSSGRMAIAVTGLHSAVAAVGIMQGDAFVPLARSPLPLP